MISGESHGRTVWIPSLSEISGSCSVDDESVRRRWSLVRLPDCDAVQRRSLRASTYISPTRGLRNKRPKCLVRWPRGKDAFVTLDTMNKRV